MELTTVVVLMPLYLGLQKGCKFIATQGKNTCKGVCYFERHHRATA